MEMKEGAWEAELEQIVTQYTDMLFRISYSMCGIAADAEDILQNVFLKLCVKRPHFRDDAHCRAWLIRVTINETKNALRFRAVRREEDIAAAGRDPAGPGAAGGFPGHSPAAHACPTG